MGKHQSSTYCLVLNANPRAALRLFCFPYVGGNAGIFATWPKSLPNDVEVWGIQLPGRQNRILELPFKRVSAAISELGTAISPLLDRPFSFFGHSMGAILGFEMTRWLRRHRKTMPITLFVSGRRAPQVPDTELQLHQLDDSSLVAAMRKFEGTPEEVLANQDLIQLLLPSLRADAELCETYEYVSEAPFSCPITAFCGTDDSQETLERMDAWREQTTGRFSLYPVEGGHFFINSSGERFLQLLRTELCESLSQNGRHGRDCGRRDS